MQGSRPDDFQAAVDHLQKGLTLLPEGHWLIVHNLAGLGRCFGARFESRGDVQDLQAAMEKDQAVRDILLDGDPDLPGYLPMLASGFLNRYQRFGSLEDLELAVEINEKAITLALNDNLVLSTLLTISAATLITRYERLDDLQDLQLAIKRFQAAVDITADDHRTKPHQFYGLGHCYGVLYERLGNLRDIDSSIDYFRAGLKLLPNGPSATFAIWHALAAYLGHRYERSNNLDDLISALEAAETFLKLAPGDPGRIAEGHDLVGRLLIKKYHAIGNVNDLQTALHNHQTAVNLLPEEHLFRSEVIRGLAASFAAQYTASGNPDHLKAAFVNYGASLQEPARQVSESWKTASMWAALAQEHDPKELLKAFKSMFSLLPETLWMGNSLSARQKEITRFDIAQRTSDAIAACIDHHNLSLAIEFLEQGLATTFQQMLQLRPDITSLPKADAKKLQDISFKLYTGTSSNIRQLAIERTKLLAEIRKHPGFKYFLLPRPYKILCKASENGPIIILNAHKNHCDCIILLSPAFDALHVPLPDVTLDRIEAQKIILKNLLNRCNVRGRISDSTRLFAGLEGSLSKSVNESFEEILAWIWERIVSLIYQALEHHDIVTGRVWWCPTGAFTGLPLHAAAPSDQFVSSYTATLGALLDAKARPRSQLPKLGLVGVTHSGTRQQSALPGVEKEIKIISALAGKHLGQTLVGEQATVDAVTSQLQNCEWVHLACHGTQNLNDAPKSCLHLYGGSLELENIMRMPLSDAEFVFLAACQTAMGDRELVNESFHLGGGFIAAGFRGSIGTMWSMCDSDGPRLAEAVYTYLFRHKTPKATDAARALQSAVRKMRDEGVPYERWVPFIHIGV
ncbi:CHAT domain-containing protein [Mycena vulgaris]|nr:CHAT domain-containing protein [Mycena vulgaris]